MIPELLAQVSEENLHKHLFHIAKDPIPFRKVNHTVPGHAKNTLDETDDFLQAKLEEYGYKVEKEEFKAQAFGRDITKHKSHQYASPVPGSPVCPVFNLYVRKEGSEFPSEIIIVIAHKDSPSWIDSPGAYDNAGGTVAVLEISRILKNYTPKRTIQFVFCNEEHFPWTSMAFAENAKTRGDNLAAVFNIDTVGGKSREDVDAGKKTSAVLYTLEPEGKELAALVTEANALFNIGLSHTEFHRQAPGDDDGSFIKAGFPAAVAIFGSYPYADPEYHLETDTADHADIANIAMATKLALASILMRDSK